MNQLYTQSPPLMPTEHTGIGGRTLRLLTRWLGITAGVFLLISTLWGSSAQAQNRPFITRWDLSKPGNGPTTLSFVCYTAPGETVSYTWQQVGGSASGSGTITNNLVNILGLPAGIILDVSIDPTHLQRIYVAGEYHFNRLTEIRQWGDVAWTSMQNAFSQCSNMTLTATDVPNLAGVTNMNAMFRGCRSFNQALPEGFDPSNVTRMIEMFSGCTAYDKALPSSFNTSNVTDMSGMFSGCTAYDKALPSSFNTSKVTSMGGMFFGCSKFNQSVSNFSTENVANMAFMFEGCAAFNQSLATFKLNDNVNLANFLSNSGLSVANYDATLKAFNAQNVTGRTMGAAGLKYCDAEADRANLVKSTAEGGKGWTITDGGKAESCAVAATPTITVTGTLEPFLACSGEPSRQQKFKVSGSDLTGDITVFVASGVEVSTTSLSNFGSSVTLTPENGSVNATIFVRSPASTVPANGGSSTSGSISVTSSGAESKSVQFRASTEPFPSITLRSIANVSTTATSFRIPFTDLTSADQYSIVASPLTSNTTPMPNFSAVTNEAFPEGSLRVPIPASAAGTYDFILTVSSTSTGCVSAEVPFTLTVEAPPAPVGRPFITRWDLSKTGSGVSGGTTSLVIGVATALGQNVSYTWQQVGGSASGSGTFTGTTLEITGLPSGATIDLSIAPANFQRINIKDGPDRQRLTEIRQWGDVAWTSMQTAFQGCSNMILTATDIPNLTGVTNMAYMFSYCSSFNQALPEGFNTSNVTNMFAMFNGCTIYDQPLPSSFNTANVTDMGYMFRQCNRYNQTLPNSFNTEKVTNMHRMFEGCFAYDKALPSSFNTANVTDMSYMFRMCSAYNKALPSGFTTAAVTNMMGMFGGCTVFDQSVSNFNTEKVTSMFLMFSNCAAFNQSVSNFNTEKVTDMRAMFFNCTAFNQSLATFTLHPEVKLTELLNNTGLSVANYDATLKAFNAQSVTGRTMGATGLQYCEAEADRTNLVKSTVEGGKGWTITDGGIGCAITPSGGTVSGSTTVCSGTNSTLLTLSGNTGNVVGWQSSTTEDFTNPTNIVNTTTSLTATNLTQTTYYRAVVINTGSAGSRVSASVIYSTVATITVSPVSVGGSVGGSTSVIAGVNSTTLTLSGHTGSVVKWQSSTSSEFTNPVDIANTTTSLTATNLSQTTYYRAVVKSGECPEATSSVATITVQSASGGTVSGSTTVCSGTNSTLLTLSGNTGNVVGWQSSTTEDFTNPTNIVNTTTSLTATNLTQTTYYRAVVINTGSAGSRVSASVIYSTVATITVSPVSVGGTVSGGTTVAAATNSTTLTLSGHTGSVVKWQSSTSSEFTNPVDMANTTTSLTVTNLTQTTHYRAVVKSGACPEAFSSVATISLEVISAGNCTEANPQCSGNQFEIAKFTLSVPSSGSRTLTLSYRAVEGNSTGRIRINGGSWQTFTLPQTAINASFVTVSIGSYSLQKGSNSIELASGVGYLCFRQLCAEGSTSSCDFTVLGSPSVLTAAPGANVTLSVGCTGSGCSGLSYQWSGAGASCASANCVLQAPTTAGSYTYTVTASKDGCTTQTATVTLTVQEQAPAGSTLSLGDQCTGNSQEIRSYSLTSTGGTFPFSLTYRSLEGNALGRIRINGGSWQVFSLPQTPANQSFATVAIGSYALINGTNTIEFASGERYFCLRQLSLEGVTNTLDCNFSIFGNPSVMSIAPGGILRLNASCSGTGCSGISYQWSGNGATCAAAECTVQAPTTAGEYTYTVTASKQGCNTTSTATVTVRVVLDVNPGVCLALGDQCSGNSQEIRSYSLSAAAAGSYPLRLSYRSHEGATQGRIRINGGSWQSFVLPQTPANLSFASVDIGSYALLNGSNSIELATGGLYMCFRELCLDAPSQNPNCGFTVKGNPASLTVAPGSTVTLNSTCSGSGCEGVSYQWSGNGATCAGTSCTVQAPTAAGSYTYTLTASKEGCSSQTTTVTVQVSAAVLPERCVALGDQCSGNSQEIRLYSLSLTAAGSYPLSLTYRSHEGATQGRIRINGGSWQTFNLAQTPGDLSYVTAAIGNYTLNAGANSIELATGERFMCFRQLCAGDNESNVRRGVYESFELPVALAMEVYPNPTSGQLTLRVRTSYSGAGVVEVLDLTGRSVQQQAVTLDAGDNQLNLNVASQPKGMYLLRVRDAAGRQGALRFIRQ